MSKPAVNPNYWRRVLTMTPEQREFLEEVLPSRDPETGRYIAGKVGGPGRAAKSHGVYNFRALVAEFVEAHGGHAEDVVVDLFGALMTAARGGDVAAARLLVERLCGKDAEQLDIAMATTQLSDTERASRLHAILEAAAKRAPKSE